MSSCLLYTSASLMGISAVPATTWAADSYKETEKAAFAKMIEEFGADYAKSLSEMDTEEVKGNAEIKVSLEDGGKAILGMLSPVDISWLADASISGNVSMSDTVSYTHLVHSGHHSQIWLPAQKHGSLQVEHIILPLLMILQQSRWVTGLQQWELKLYTLTKILQSVTSRMSFAGMKLRFEGKNA